MDPQFVQPGNNQPQQPMMQAPQELTPAPAPIQPAAPQPLFAPDAPMMSPKKPKGKKVLVILLILILLGAVGGGAYYYFVMMKNDTNDAATTSQEPAPTTEPATAALSCLEPNDYDSIYKEVSGTARPAEKTYAKTNYTQEVSFNPDSTDFSTPASTSEGVITAFATFTKANKETKEFKIAITGEYANDKQAEIDLANKRAEKVKELLTKKGADASVIVVKEATLVKSTATPETPETTPTAAKTVKISIDSTCKTTETKTETTPATTPEQ